MKTNRTSGFRHRFTRLWVVVAVLVSIGGFFDFGPKLEKTLGRDTYNSMKQDPGFNQTPLLNRYVQTMGERIGKVADRRRISYIYNIVNADEENAFAAGAGYTFITLGMLKMSDMEDEVAAVLGHETSHNSDKHVIQAVKENLALGIGFLALSSKMSNDQALLFGALAQLRGLHYGRQDENRADQLGVIYASRAGYNPYYMLTEFEKLEKAYPTGKMSKLDVALASHPRTPDRMRKMQGEINRVEADPKQSLALGQTLYARGYYKESQHYLLAAEKTDPANPRVHLALAETSRALGESSAAQDHLTRARQTDPGASLPPDSQVILASMPGSGAPTDFGDVINALDGQETFLSTLVATDRSALNDAIDRLDKIAEQEAQRQDQQRRNNQIATQSPAFDLAVKAVNELNDLYSADNNMKRIVTKSKSMLERTKDIPALYPGEVREAANCLIGPSSSLKGGDPNAAPKVRDTVFAYA
ncbi:MAG: M48 family metalloprotease, partial [bacterium]